MSKKGITGFLAGVISRCLKHSGKFYRRQFWKKQRQAIRLLTKGAEVKE